MTDNLPALNESLPFRIIESEIGAVVPVVDIADTIGYHRSTFTRIVKANADLFGGTQIYRPIQTSGGIQQFLCVNRAGVDLLLLLIKPSRTRDSFEKFLQLRERILTKLDIQKQAGPQEQVPHQIDTEIQKARHFAELTGGDLRAFQAAALMKCGEPDYAKALLQSVPPVVHGEPGWLNPSQLGERCGLNAREINSYLYNHGYQYPQDGIWRIQPKGEPYGEEYWFEAPSSHREIRIRWRESILYASGLKREQPAALPAARA
jgi:hypothetical protein